MRKLNLTFMRHKFLVLPVKKLLKSVHIYGSYHKIKPAFLDRSVQSKKNEKPNRYPIFKKTDTENRTDFKKNRPKNRKPTPT